MKRIGILLLIATTIAGAAPALSQDQGGDRRERGSGPNGGNRPPGGERGGPDRGQPNMQQQRPGNGNGVRPGAAAQPAPNAGVAQGRDPNGTRGDGQRGDGQRGDGQRGDGRRGDGGRDGQRFDGQRPSQPGRDFQQNRPGYDRGNRDDRGGYNRGNGYGGGNYSHTRPPSGNYWRPGNSRPSSNYWRNNRWNNRPVYAPAYRYPRGYSYRQWRPGLILPSLFLGSSNYFNGFDDLGLSAPPYGYRWVRYGPDLVLVDVRSGRIRDVRYGIFG